MLSGDYVVREDERDVVEKLRAREAWLCSQILGYRASLRRAQAAVALAFAIATFLGGVLLKEFGPLKNFGL